MLACLSPGIIRTKTWLGLAQTSTFNVTLFSHCSTQRKAYRKTLLEHRAALLLATGLGRVSDAYTDVLEYRTNKGTSDDPI